MLFLQSIEIIEKSEKPKEKGRKSIGGRKGEEEKGRKSIDF